ncbi:MAG: hypothetical protein PWQ70_1993 [Clostridiales bacterium]|jgi:hypothetical protein|nr:hypothetical protein [Clostridiales bacterium]
MYLAIIDVKPLKDYKLLLTFENGEKRIFDMKPYLNKGIFKELKDEKLFRSVRVIFDSIEWSNQADIDPEVLYEDSVAYETKGTVLG